MIVTAPDAALCAALAALHAEAFAEDARGWRAEEIAALAAAPGAALAVADAPPIGFGLLRVAADEAELLTLAVRPAARRRGVGGGLLATLARHARAAGAGALWLEVSADNSPARALYAAHGFVEAGRRRAYYARREGPAADALVLTRPL